MLFITVHRRQHTHKHTEYIRTSHTHIQTWEKDRDRMWMQVDGSLSLSHTHAPTHTQQGACVNWGRYMASSPLPGFVGFGDFSYLFPGPVSPLSPVKIGKGSVKHLFYTSSKQRHYTGQLLQQCWERSLSGTMDKFACSSDSGVDLYVKK